MDLSVLNVISRILHSILVSREPGAVLQEHCPDMILYSRVKIYGKTQLTRLGSL